MSMVILAYYRASLTDSLEDILHTSGISCLKEIVLNIDAAGMLQNLKSKSGGWNIKRCFKSAKEEPRSQCGRFEPRTSRLLMEVKRQGAGVHRNLHLGRFQLHTNQSVEL